MFQFNLIRGFFFACKYHFHTSHKGALYHITSLRGLLMLQIWYRTWITFNNVCGVFNKRIWKERAWVFVGMCNGRNQNQTGLTIHITSLNFSYVDQLGAILIYFYDYCMFVRCWLAFLLYGSPGKQVQVH